MRAARTDLPRRRRRYPGGRAGIVVTVGAVFLLLTSLRGIAIFWTDELWFSSVHLTGVWAGILGAKVGLAAAFSVLFFVLLWVNLAIADRLAPRLGALGPEDEFVQRYRTVVGRRPLLVRTSASIVLALLVGTEASGEWNNWILFRNAVPFGVRDPQFHRDVSFWVFKLPFLSFLVGWAFVALVVVAIVTAVAHYLNGGIHLQGPGQRVSSQVKAHLSLLLGLIALVKAAGYFLQRYQLDLSNRGYRQGAFYTDVHAQLPALTLLIFISLVSFVIFIVNIRRQGWVLPIIGVSLWAFISLVVGAIYPAIVQTFSVQPAQLSKELPYIQRNVTATRFAMGIGNVVNTPFTDAQSPRSPQSPQGLTDGQLASHLSTLEDVRLWDPQFAGGPFAKLQSLRSYYEFDQLGIDRYQLGPNLTPTIVSVRQVNSGGLPASSWVNDHLQYTHGYGAVLSPANVATSDGNPAFFIQGVPPAPTPGAPAGTPQVSQPDVYFGTNLGGYVIANTKQKELDYQTPDGASVESNYAGGGGVPAGSVLRRAAFALRFGDINPLISSLVTSNSRMMFVRDIQARVAKVAPFLGQDAQPYPVIVDGQIDYLIDAYTTTDRYPYAQSPDPSIVGALNPNSGLNTDFNYVRNSVKAVVNAYTGKMTLYVVDPSDPIIQVYEKAFPKLFTSAAAMPAALRDHLRYPQDLFTVQTGMYGRYHITDPVGFYNAGDAWDLAQDPGTGAISSFDNTTPTNNGGQIVGPSQSRRMSPIYQVSQLPGDSSLTFNLLEPYVPVSQGDTQQNLTGFLVARCDPAKFGDGQLEDFYTPRGQQLNGPALVSTQIHQNTKISQQITLLNTNGSTVLLGTLLLVPIDQSVLYIRPLYVSSTQNSVPQLQQVIAVYGNQSAMAPTLAQALGGVGIDVTGLGSTPSGTGSGSALAPPGAPLPGATSPTVAADIKQADDALAQAQADLKAGDLGSYQAEVDKAQALLKAATQAMGSPPAGAGAASPGGAASSGRPGSAGGSGLGGTSSPPKTAGLTPTTAAA